MLHFRLPVCRSVCWLQSVQVKEDIIIYYRSRGGCENAVEWHEIRGKIIVTPFLREIRNRFSTYEVPQKRTTVVKEKGMKSGKNIFTPFQR